MANDLDIALFAPFGFQPTRPRVGESDAGFFPLQDELFHEHDRLLFAKGPK